MPYLRCAGCGVLSYVPGNAPGASCPDCGVPVPVGAVAEAAIRTADTNRRLDALIRLTRDLLDTEIAALTQVRDGREVAQRVAGEWPGRTSLENISIPLEETFCQRMLEGRIGNYVHDAANDPRVADLAMAQHFGVRSWLGVPIELDDMQLYILCCLASEARPGIGDREVRMLRGLAESVRAELTPRTQTSDR